METYIDTDLFCKYVIFRLKVVIRLSNVISPLSGVVFNIQRYSVHDGPGIRTIVFLKGCPLGCLWCANPEGMQPQPQLMYNENKCIGTVECGECLKVCGPGVIQETEDRKKVLINRTKWLQCGKCIKVCPSNAIEMVGKNMTAQEVLDAVEEDLNFYARSGGGLTLSGGEPLFQHEFCVEILKEAKKRKVHTAIETSGYVNWNHLENALQYIDYVLFDVKCMDSDKHKRFTGVSNKLILNNLIKLSEKFSKIPIKVRTPVIPGFNDSDEDISTIKDFVIKLSNVTEYELLTYHRLGELKYSYLNCEYPMKGVLPLNKEFMEHLNQIYSFKK